MKYKSKFFFIKIIFRIYKILLISQESVVEMQKNMSGYHF